LKKTILIVLGVLLGLLITLAVLTKTEVIENYFEIPFLCPNRTEIPYIVQPNDPNTPQAWKPVIYLYPTQKQEVSVNLDYPGELLITYPEYEDGWKVTANPDGTLINNKDEKEYSYLFWEGKEKSKTRYDMTTGFVVKGVDTSEFLQKTLSEIGLTPKEYNEFIVYWAPQMIRNEYNLIHFATDSEYADRVKLNITPTPDSVLRVFMVYKSLDKYVEVEPQILPTFERNGFTVIEWGGSEIN
jgi:hypothetical protein